MQKFITIIFILIVLCSCSDDLTELSTEEELNTYQCDEMKFVWFSPPSLPMTVYAYPGMEDAVDELADLYGPDILTVVDDVPRDGYGIQYGEVPWGFDAISFGFIDPYYGTITMSVVEDRTNDELIRGLVAMIGRRLGVHGIAPICMDKGIDMILLRQQEAQILPELKPVD